jgi:hypothetical protein
MIEVRSQGQTRAQLQRKLEAARAQLPENRRGSVLVLEEGQAVVTGAD